MGKCTAEAVPTLTQYPVLVISSGGGNVEQTEPIPTSHSSQETLEL